MKRLLYIATLTFSALGAVDLAKSAPEVSRVESATAGEARSRVTAVLRKYCADACELINVDATVSEYSTESDDLGFEGITNDQTTSIKVNKLMIDVQVDDRVSASDQDRLGKLLENSVRGLGASATIRWSSVAFPQIGVSAEVEDRLKQVLKQRVQTAVQQVIDSYCISECVLANVMVDGKLASPDESRGVPDRELVRDSGGRGVLRVLNVDVDLSVDEKLPEATRLKIFNLIKAKTRFVYPININIVPVDFPEVSASAAAKDPWGLDRLRQTLQIFRDLAGTKEIITNSTSTNSNSSLNRESSNIERSELRDSKETSSINSKEKMSASEKSIANSATEKSAALNSSEKSEGMDSQYMMYAAAFLVLILILAAVFLRFASASRDARALMDTMPSGQGSRSSGLGFTDQNQAAPMGAVAVSGTVNRENLSLKMKIEILREDLLRAFVDNPKVARDTFSRMLQEEGVFQTSRYVHIFGPMIIFDLMNDPSLQRDLNDLSDFYHKSTFSFNDEQILELLNSLKTKVTASEIRVMARKRLEQFDFLQQLDASQIYSLILEERPHIQSIVLTQLDHVRRRNVFDLYSGEPRVALMKELCKADAIPKEYLANVAKALHKKVLSRTEFDTEQLRSSDILIELLEKSPLLEQRKLMADLVRTNPESARLIKLKLVTVEMLPYLRDGHLLETVMGLEREELLTFLVGAPEHIRGLLLSKAPAELAQSWLEDIEQSAGIEEGRYRIAEMRVLGRVRNLANNGAIRLVDINDRIFAPESLAEVREEDSLLNFASGASPFAA